MAVDDHQRLKTRNQIMDHIVAVISNHLTMNAITAERGNQMNEKNCEERNKNCTTESSIANKSRGRD